MPNSAYVFAGVTIRSVLQDLGIEAANVLRRADLPEDLLTREDGRLNADQYFRFWESIGQESDDPLLPLRIAEVISAEAFVPPIFAALCSPNFEVATDRLARFKKLIAPMTLSTHSTETEFTVSVRWLDNPRTPPASLVAKELAFLLRLARLATRTPVEALRVTSPTPPQPADAYAQFFGVAVETGPECSVTVSREDALRPFLTSDPELWSSFEPSLRQRLAELDASAKTSEKVRAALLECLPSGRTTMPIVATRLTMSQRTLQRRLQEESTSFQEILSQTRADLARHYLANTEIPNAQIAFLLGFRDTNSFYRAFREWTGTTPETMRSELSRAEAS